MTTPRDEPTATLLQDGLVLIAGEGPSCDLYNPKSGTFTPTGALGTARWGSTATLLKDGRVLVAGGLDQDAEGLASAELYTPPS